MSKEADIKLINFSFYKMSKAYYYCKNFSFKEVNNLFAYATKKPENLSTPHRIARLYK